MSSVLCPPAEFSGALSGSFVEVDPRRPDNTPEFTVMPFPPRDLGPRQRYFHQPAQNCHMRVSAVCSLRLPIGLLHTLLAPLV